MTKIFVSYRRDDSADITGRIYDHLTAQFGRENVFKDVDSIPFGVNFKTYLDDQVKQCAVLLAIIGKQWLSITDENGNRRLDNPRDFVRIEIESALQRGIPVIPLLVQNVAMPNENALPESLVELTYRNGTVIRRDPDFHSDMNRLIRGLEKWLDSPPSDQLPPTSVASVRAVPKGEMSVTDLFSSSPLAEREQGNDINIPSLILAPNVRPIEWCEIPPGHVEVRYADNDGRAFHVGNRFYIAKYPITNAQYEVFLSAKDGYKLERYWDYSEYAKQWRVANPVPGLRAFEGNDLPRTNVTWYEAVAFCRWLTNQLGFEVGLPTEEQWQLAAQGGEKKSVPLGTKIRF